VRKGYRFAGMATVVGRGEAAFDTLLPSLRSALAHRIRAIVTIAVTKALPLTSPAYDEGKTEAELRRAWTTRFPYAPTIQAVRGVTSHPPLHCMSPEMALMPTGPCSV
jgi:hypothetical protein